jgi:hypothetical protein
MITKLTPEPELAQLWLEIFFNTQDKVTKASEGSVVHAIARGTAKLAQKSLVETARQESRLFVDEASGPALDEAARNSSLPGARLGALPATAALRLVGAEGTSYPAGLTITGPHGKTFELQATARIGPYGFTYARALAQEAGTQTNVAALTLVRLAQPPVGHAYCINEAPATGGRDQEDDASLRGRCRNALGLYARGTLQQLEQIMLLANANVLRVLHQGTDRTGQTTLAVVTQNGAELTAAELGALVAAVQPFLSLSELRPDGLGGTGLRLRNVPFAAVDVSLRVELYPEADPDRVRAELAARLQALLDYRYWTPGQTVEWDNLLEAAKATPGVRYIPDQHFYPRRDLAIPRDQLPRLRGFLLLDLAGAPLVDASGALVPYFYPGPTADFSELQTILPTLPA